MTLDPTTARRRATVRLLQKAQHAVPAFVLVGHGIAALREGAHGWHLALAVAEVAVSAAVFVAFARAIRDHRAQLKNGGVPHVHTGIDWVDILLGAMLFTEAWAKYMETAHLARPTIVLGIVMIVFGLFGGKFIAWKQARSNN
jgi:hypothetical protein